MQTKPTHSIQQILAVTLVAGMLATTGCQKTEDNETTSDAAETSEQSQDATDGQTSSDPEGSENSVYTITDHGSDEESAASAGPNDAVTADGDTLTTLEEKGPIDPSGQQNSHGASNDMTSSSNVSNQATPGGETQITEVDYKDAEGRHINVTYQTSATSVLQANVTMPSGKSLLLTAPPAQGNNPTYKSADGEVELVTHAGGNKVDFIFQGKSISFTAVETDAAIVVAQ